jgi:hypothetical protein
MTGFAVNACWSGFRCRLRNTRGQKGGYGSGRSVLLTQQRQHAALVLRDAAASTETRPSGKRIVAARATRSRGGRSKRLARRCGGGSRIRAGLGNGLQRRQTRLRAGAQPYTAVGHLGTDAQPQTGVARLRIRARGFVRRRFRRPGICRGRWRRGLGNEALVERIEHFGGTLTAPRASLPGRRRVDDLRAAPGRDRLDRSLRNRCDGLFGGSRFRSGLARSFRGTLGGLAFASRRLGRPALACARNRLPIFQALRDRWGHLGGPGRRGLPARRSGPGGGRLVRGLSSSLRGGGAAGHGTNPVSKANSPRM